MGDIEVFYALRLNGKNPVLYPPNKTLELEDMSLVDKILLEIAKLECKYDRELFLISYFKDKNRLVFYDLVTPYGEDDNREEIILNGIYYAIGDRLNIVDL